MAETIEQAILGVSLSGYWKAGVYLYDVFSGAERKELEEQVTRMLPIIEQICESNSGEPQNVSLERFQQFHDYIIEGNRLVDECPRFCVCLRKFWIAIRVEKLQKYINEFIQFDLPCVMALQHIQAHISVSSKLKDIIDRQNVHFAQLLNMGRDAVTLIQASDRKMDRRMETLQNVFEEILRSCVEQVQHSEISEEDESHLPDLPRYLVGFDDHIIELKKFVLEERVNVVGITAMGGAGKSTLVAAVCKDNEIRGYFMKKVIYILVSKSPNLLRILQIMWENIVGEPASAFKNVDDAHIKLEFRIKLTKSEPILVVLDDVWSDFPLEKLLFEGEQLTTVVTTRDKNIIPEGPKTRFYELPLLQKEHALSLFCCHAFGQTTIPIGRDKELVMKVQQHYNGLPLALEVIGRSLKGKSDCDWKSTMDKLATGEFAEDNQINALRKCLETSINALNPREKQCFLDLAVFPKGRTNPANVLLDIWVYVRRMKRDDALLLLRKFEACHLLDLKRDPGTPESKDDCMDGYSVSQHDVMRELALFLAEQDNEVHFSRLYMPQRQSKLPHEWQTEEDRLCRAQIVSINTGAMKDTQWPGMDFPVAEALVLYFSATEYCIPTFLDKMKRLKVLIIYNDNSKRAQLCGLGGFQGTSQLKTLYLERLIVPPLNEDCKGLNSLEKISLVLCEGLGKDTIFNFPGLLEINVDYCIDLEELPAGLCSSVSLKKLSVNHCHRLAKLPDEMDRLESLEEIILCESLGLEELPPSISSLRKLEYVDISSCIHLKVTRWGRSELKSTLEAVAKLSSLKRVICDKANEELFKRSSRNNLKVQAVDEEEPNLDWLDLPDDRN